MKIVFFGTSEFAVPTLRALREAHDILAVVTQPDRPAGRGQRLVATPVKTCALELGLVVHEPLRLRGEFAEQLVALDIDAVVVVSYGRILPEAVLAANRYGAFNLHPSALPLYRGAMPINGPIRDGRSSTDVCVMLMDAGLDTGDVVVRKTYAIEPDETATSLHDRLAEAGAELMLDALRAAASGTLTRQPQASLADEATIVETFTRPLAASDLLLDWNWHADRIVNFVRAYAERPAARCDLAGERVKLLHARRAGAALPSSTTPGRLVGIEGNAALVACGDGIVAIDRLVPPSRGAQDGAVFARSRMSAAR